MKRLVIVCMAVFFMVACGSSESNEETVNTGTSVPTDDYGKDLFTQNCAQCHKVNDDMIGPALVGALERWGNDKEAIRAFIKDSRQMIKSGDERAIKVYNRWNKTLMTPMPHLTDKDIDAILDYTERIE